MLMLVMPCCVLSDASAGAMAGSVQPHSGLTGSPAVPACPACQQVSAVALSSCFYLSALGDIIVMLCPSSQLLRRILESVLV